MFFSFTYRFLNIIAPILVLVFSHSFILYLCTPDNSRPPPFFSRQLRIVTAHALLLLSLAFHSSIFHLFIPLSLLYFSSPLGNLQKESSNIHPSALPSPFIFFFLLFSFLFLLCSAHVTSGPDGGLVLEKLPQFGPFFKISFPPHISSFFLNIG